MKQPAPTEAVALLRTMSKVLCTVGALALIFTTVNVTRFATSRGVPLPIAILLDPMIGTALACVLYVDARLASWNIRPPRWSTALRWTTGCTAALMNTWQSLWPDRRIGWPHHTDPAAVLLHLTPALLLITLTETIAAYRTTINDLLSTTIGPPTNRSRSSSRTTNRPITPTLTDPGPTTAAPLPHNRSRSGTEPGASGTPAAGQHPPATHRPRHAGEPPPADQDPATGSPPTDTEIWLRAIALNDVALATTGDPVSVWRLRTHLRIGPHRARQIRDQLLTDRPEPP